MPLADEKTSSASLAVSWRTWGGNDYVFIDLANHGLLRRILLTSGIFQNDSSAGKFLQLDLPSLIEIDKSWSTV